MVKWLMCDESQDGVDGVVGEAGAFGLVVEGVGVGVGFLAVEGGGFEGEAVGGDMVE